MVEAVVDVLLAQTSFLKVTMLKRENTKTFRNPSKLCNEKFFYKVLHFPFLLLDVLAPPLSKAKTTTVVTIKQSKNFPTIM